MVCGLPRYPGLANWRDCCGVIHNPHYFQWARSQSANGEIPRQPGDNAPQNQCENLNFPLEF